MVGFGTDGVRGVAGIEFSAKEAYWLGVAVSKFLGGGNGRVVLAKDTRTSGDVFLHAIASGLCHGGSNVVLCGVLPSPAVGFLTKKYAASGGISVTASHDKPDFNGVKIFDASGKRIDKDTEQKIEQFVFRRHRNIGCKECGAVAYEARALFDYVEFLCESAWFDLSGLLIVVDVAHGACSSAAKMAFEKLGAAAIFLNDDNSGEFVNVACGTQDVARLKGAVVRYGADMGFAFDADGDRVCAVDNLGNVVDGDKIGYLFAVFLKENERLVKNTIVGNEFSSLALERALTSKDIMLYRATTGEQVALEVMKQEGYMLYCERDGKIVLKELLSSSDALICALFVAKIVKQEQKTLYNLVSDVFDLPNMQKCYNLEWAQLAELETDKKFKRLLQRIRKAKPNLRVEARASKTENVLRAYVEGDSLCDVENAFAQIERFVLRFCGG